MNETNTASNKKSKKERQSARHTDLQMDREIRKKKSAIQGV